VPHTKHKYRKLRSLYIWHRYMGVSVALLVIILSVTGLALNHTDKLSLDKEFVQSEILLDWYGIKPPAEIILFNNKQRVLVYIDSKFYLDKKLLSESFNKPAGIIYFPHFMAIATDSEIILITHEGEIIERLSSLQGIPAKIKKIGRQLNNIYIKTVNGLYVTDRDFIKWKKSGTITNIQWSQSSNISEQQRVTYTQLYRGNILSLERVVLDLHSGRLLGKWGPTIMDTAAILLLVLAFSGTWLWLKQLLRKKKRRLKRTL